jgi:hypothetical protein
MFELREGDCGAYLGQVGPASPSSLSMRLPELRAFRTTQSEANPIQFEFYPKKKKKEK